MLFGVYFIFFGINDLITHRMNNMKRRGVGAEKIVVSRKRFFMNVLAIISILIGAACTLMALEGWSFITALYFVVQTTAVSSFPNTLWLSRHSLQVLYIFFILRQTIGFGDIEKPSYHTRIFLCVYIIISAGLVAYLFSNLNIVKNGLKLLDEKEKQAQKRLTLEFMLSMDSGGRGVSQAEFVLAILEHEGVISKEKDITPWLEKFNTLDETKSGRLYKKVG